MYSLTIIKPGGRHVRLGVGRALLLLTRLARERFSSLVHSPHWGHGRVIHSCGVRKMEPTSGIPIRNIYPVFGGESYSRSKYNSLRVCNGARYFSEQLAVDT